MNDNFKQWQIDTGQDLDHVMKQKNVSAEDLKSAGICSPSKVKSYITGGYAFKFWGTFCDILDYLDCKLDIVKNGE